MTCATRRLKMICAVHILYVLGCGCSSTRIDAEVDARADFSKLKTFAWVPFQQRGSGSSLDATIRNTASRELARKGMTQIADPAQADVWISYYAVSENGTVFGKAPSPWRFGPVDEVTSVRDGSLTIEFIDPASNQDLWQGSATNIVRTPEDPRRVANAVKELIGKYPAA